MTPDSSLTPGGFPTDFLWGTATAAYQIEGVGEPGGRGLSIWDTFSRSGGVLNHDNGDVACDHYHRLDEDLDLLQRLGVNSYRFSLSWSRLQPDGEGALNVAGLDFYRRIVAGLQERSITPLVTLYHWDLPQALEDRGGWSSREVAQRFADYVDLVAAPLVADGAQKWITINEPWCVSWLGYGKGDHAPGHRDVARGLAANHHVLLAHGLGVDVLRSVGAPEVGITLNLSVFTPASEDPLDVAAAARARGNLNGLFLDPVFRGEYPPHMVEHYSAYSPGFDVVHEGDLEVISRPLDFLGVNYYSASVICDPSRVAEVRSLGFNAGPPSSNPFDLDLAAVAVGTPSDQVTLMGWPVQPVGLTDLLVSLRDEYTELPILITENGAAYADYVNPAGEVHDPERVAYIDQHLVAVRDAIAKGVNVKGYFLWSLLDNFEWALGYSRRFGIVWVDYPTGTRIPKDSFKRYREVITSAGAIL